MKHISLFCTQVKAKERMTKHYFVWWAWFITEVEEGGGWKPCRSCWVIMLAKRETKRWNLCLSWQAGTVTIAQIAWAPRKLQQTAGRQGKKQAETGAMRSLLFVSLSLSQTQTAKVPACHQGHTDGSLLGGCGCNTDRRGKVVLFAAAHIHVHTTAQQINTITSVRKKHSLPTVKYNSWDD